MKGEYLTVTQNPHGREEELQWARIIQSGIPIKGMVVIFLQKMCAAFHEFEPAYHAGGLQESALPYFRVRLSRRIQSVLNVLDLHQLQDLQGGSDLRVIQTKVAYATSLLELANLAEPVHQANHILTDALEALEIQ